MTRHLHLAWSQDTVTDEPRLSQPLNDHLYVYRRRGLFGSKWHWRLISFYRGTLAESPFGYLSRQSAEDGFADAFDVDVWDGHHRQIHWYADDNEDGYRRTVDLIVLS